MNIIQRAPYIREQRKFPREDMTALSREIDQAYIDIANKLNSRTIGFYPTNVQAITGEKWFLEGQPRQQQTIRQVYTFTSFSAIQHGIDTVDNPNFYFTMMYGQFTDGTDWYGIIPGNYNDAITGQIVFSLTSSNIEFGVDAGAPSIVKGVIVLEWLSSYDTNS